MGDGLRTVVPSEEVPLSEIRKNLPNAWRVIHFGGGGTPFEMMAELDRIARGAGFGVVRPNAQRRVTVEFLFGGAGGLATVRLDRESLALALLGQVLAQSTRPAALASYRVLPRRSDSGWCLQPVVSQHGRLNGHPPLSLSTIEPAHLHAAVSDEELAEMARGQRTQALPGALGLGPQSGYGPAASRRTRIWSLPAPPSMGSAEARRLHEIAGHMSLARSFELALVAGAFSLELDTDRGPLAFELNLRDLLVLETMARIHIGQGGHSTGAYHMLELLALLVDSAPIDRFGQALTLRDRAPAAAAREPSRVSAPSDDAEVAGSSPGSTAASPPSGATSDRGEGFRTIPDDMASAFAAAPATAMQVLARSTYLHGVVADPHERSAIYHAIEVVLRHGGMMTAQRFAEAVEQPAFRVAGYVAKLSERLNRDGYRVLWFDHGSGSVRLDIQKLKRLFESE